MIMPSCNIPLPVRVAHPPRPQLEHLTDAYFEFLVRAVQRGALSGFRPDGAVEDRVRP